MKPFFSIIIPTYNNAATLPSTLDSVFAQSFRDYEVIIVNDGGQDPSEFLRIDDARLQIVNLVYNGGVSTARNAGFDRARGRYVYFLDSDDLISTDLLDSVVPFICERKPKILVFGRYTVGESSSFEGSRILATPAARKRDLPFEVLDAIALYEAIRIRNGLFTTSAAFFLRSALAETLGRSPWSIELRNSEDTYLFLQMGACHPVFLLKDKFLLYVVRKNSLSSNKLASWAARARAMDMIQVWLAEHRHDSRLVLLARGMRHTAMRRVARLHHQAGRRKEALDVLVEDLRRQFTWKTALLLLISWFVKKLW